MKSNLLKAARIKQSLTQVQVSEKLGIDKSTYSKKEKGIIQFKITEIQKLVSIYNLTKEEMIEIFFADCVDFESTLCS